MLVCEDLGVDDAGAVVDGSVDVAVAGTAMTVITVVASSSTPPAAPIGDPGQFLDVNMDELTGVFPFITVDRCGIGGSVTPVETTHTSLIEDLLHRGGG